MSNVSTVHYPDGVGTVHTIHHPTAPCEVWCDSTDEPMIGIEVRYPGLVGDDPAYVPVSVARQVAAAIMAAIPD